MQTIDILKQALSSLDPTQQQQLLVAGSAVAVGGLLTCYYWVYQGTKTNRIPIGDGWWGAGEKPQSEDETVFPFQVQTSDEEIQDLYDRIDRTRYTEPLEDTGFQYGFNSTYLKKVVSHWRHQFNWKKQIAILNKYPQFKTNIEGCGVNDSPVGLAAYILEKFSTWTDFNNRDLEDGGLERKFTLDDLLTNIMIYWTTGSIVSSMRFYKENLKTNIDNRLDNHMGVYVPTGLAAFPNELMHVPQVWARAKFRNIYSYSYMPRGGHFAAFEEPQLLADDLLQFVKKVEKL
ncbi:epoxide hydrolase 1-like isoform X2 [Oncorhynchus keta]|uniref:epoxide hydrolase 1-like isoform X2 n=1 Tax=Oncorhynchus keta TaxID=8018 RepID=UPI00227B5F87|nr:epoxide hydrolase 1-like isoform X2 [Oncorhynchus keta]